MYWAATGILTALTALADPIALEDRKHWQAITDEFQPGEAALILFHTPWCSHCRRAEPEFAKASELLLDWPRTLLNRTILATFNCDANRATCSRLGYFEYPMIALADDKGLIVGEYPNWPRRAENFLSWLAFTRRRSQIIPSATPEIFSLNMKAYIGACGRELMGQEKDYSFATSLCRALLTKKYFLGTTDTLQKISDTVPLKLSRSIVQMEVPITLATQIIPSKHHLCAMDRHGKDGPNCLDMSDESADLSGFIRMNREVDFVENANWQAFFEMKERAAGRRIIVAAVEEDDSTTSEMLKEILRESTDFYGMTWSVKREASEPLFKQLNLDATVNKVVVFQPKFTDRGYYPYSGAMRTSSIRDWLAQITNKQIRPTYPTGFEPGWIAGTLREVRIMVKVLRNAARNMPLSAYLKITAGLIGAACSITFAFWLTADRSDAAMDRLSKRLGPVVARRRPLQPPAAATASDKVEAPAEDTLPAQTTSAEGATAEETKAETQTKSRKTAAVAAG